MPVLKNPCKLKMANGDTGGGGGGDSLILEKGSHRGTNPFEEDLEENEGDSFLGSDSADSRNPSPDGGGGFERGLFNGSPEGRYRRRATLEKLVGLSPFRLGKGKKGGEKKSPGSGEKGSDRRSFLGRMMIPLTEGNQGTPEKRKTRRSSEDFSLLQRLNGRRKESLYALDCGLSEKENGGGGDKRISFLKIGLGGKVRRASLVEKLNQTEAPEPSPVAEEVEVKVKEPLSVLEILNLIHKRDLLVADEHIIELEAECQQDGQQSPEGSEVRKSGSRKAKDVALLYEALQKELWAVLAESLAGKSSCPALELVVRVIEQEEDTDRKWLAAQGEQAGGCGPRPRAMKQQWAEAVRQLVGQRLQQCTEGRLLPVATQMDRLAKCALEDLCTVKFHLLHAYPKEYEAFGVYLCSFHQGLARCLAEAVQKKLSISDLYFVLDWSSNIYQREVLGRAEISSLVRTQELGPLLSPETRHSLEEDLLEAVKAKVTEDMSQELQKEEEGWAQEDAGEGFQFGLSGKIILVLKAHVDKAPQITEDFGARMAHCCLICLADLLQSFQRKVERFHEGQIEKALPADTLMGRTIMLINHCPPFRDYVERLARFGHPESEAVRGWANASLDRVTRLCNKVLADHLFQDLKPHFQKLMKRKWLSNSEAFSTILGTLEDHAQKLRKMKLEPYQMLVREVHRQVLIEYVRPLMRVRFVCTTSKMRSKVANKLRDEAKKLKDFFIQLESTSSWLDKVVPHLAEIIELEGIPAIQMEVGFLAKDFPDVQKKHVSAILDIRGLQNQSHRQDILAALETLELSEGGEVPCLDRSFFNEIPTSKVFCVRLQLRCVSFMGVTGLSRLRQMSWRRQRQRHRQRTKESEAESQV